MERDPDVVREARDLEEAAMVRFMVSFLVVTDVMLREVSIDSYIVLLTHPYSPLNLTTQ